MGDSTFNGGWIFAFLIIAVIFGWGGGLGGNANAAAFATMADVNAALANQSTQQALGAIQLSSANNNYETAQLISSQNMQMMNQSNSNLVNEIQGFNQISSNLNTGFANVSSQIADLGYRLDQCCCSIKTQMLEQRLADANAALVTSQTANAINAQSQYLLSQLGTYTPAAVV